MTIMKNTMIEIFPPLPPNSETTNPSNMITSFLSRNPWLYVVLAFAVLLGAWSALISVATKYSPQQIEVWK